MLEPGMPLIVGDEDLQDQYIGELVKMDSVSQRGLNLIVRIRFILRYPIQHAIIWPDVPKENAPVAQGTICRLTFCKAADASLLARWPSYEDSRQEALQTALTAAQHDFEREILHRHIRGDVRVRRVVRCYKEWEL